MKQYIGVKFCGSGPYSPDTSGITYNYYNDPDVSGDLVAEFDMVVVETRYGPSVARVVEVYDTQKSNATCQVQEVLSGPFYTHFVKVNKENATIQEKVKRIAKIKKEICTFVRNSEEITVAKIIAGRKKCVRNTTLEALLDELEDLRGGH